MTSILDSPKYFWKYVSLKNKTSRLPKGLFLDTINSDSDLESANLFKEFFKSVYDTNNNVNMPVNK